MWAEPALRSLGAGPGLTGLALLGAVGWLGERVLSPTGVHLTPGRPNLVTAPGRWVGSWAR